MAYSDEIRQVLPVSYGALQDTKFVASIDFGTTYSGYAFQKKEQFDDAPLVIRANKWGGQKSLKTPSSILFDENKRFFAFGEDAEKKFGDLSADDEHKGWFYFRRFKMFLYSSKGLKYDAMLPDSNLGNSMPAMVVFSSAIRYLKQHLLDRLDEDIDKDSIRWVITVPAIWDDAAKQFMREASEEAGIKSERLILSLEPEAASLFCRYIPVNRQTLTGGELAIASFGEGDRYMILDVGGGTVDITVHEVHSETNGKGICLRELYKANGGDCGGTSVDEAFEHLLNELLTPEVMEYFLLKHRADFIELMGGFEIKKRSIRPGLSTTEYISLPSELINVFKEKHGMTPEYYSGMPTKYSGKVTVDGNKLRMHQDIWKELFKGTCDRICKFAHEYFDSIPECHGEVSHILMVGGFSESPMLQDAVKTNFPQKRLIIPEEAGLAVLKGAVLYGHDPSMIRARVCKYSYGIATMKQFEPALDKPERRVVINGRPLCKGAFSVHAKIGQRFELNESVGEQIYLPSELGNELIIDVYSSDSERPKYVDEPGCDKIGQMILPLEGHNVEDQSPIKVQFVFGDTELKVVATDVNTGKPKYGKFDFLRHETNC